MLLIDKIRSLTSEFTYIDWDGNYSMPNLLMAFIPWRIAWVIKRGYLYLFGYFNHVFNTGNQAPGTGAGFHTAHWLRYRAIFVFGEFSLLGTAGILAYDWLVPGAIGIILGIVFMWLWYGRYGDPIHLFSLAAVSVELQRLRDENAKLKDQVAAQDEKILDLEAQIAVLSTKVNGIAHTVEYLTELKDRMGLRFSITELNSLCFELGIDSGIMSDGDTTTQKSRLLVDYCNRHGIIDKLLTALKDERPNQEW